MRSCWAARRARVRRCRVAGPRWHRPHPGRRRPGFVRPLARCAARHRRPERLAIAPGARGPGSPRAVGRPWRPGRCRGARCARVAGHVDQPARRIHGRRVQRPPPVTAGPGGSRHMAAVTSLPAVSRAPGPDDPDEREEHQRNQANREARCAQSQTQAGDMAARTRADQVGGRACHHEKPARHDHHGADHRQGHDKPHPPGRDGISAHRSTIASRFAPRKPYRQVADDTLSA